MTLGAHLRLLAREARGGRGRLLFFVACLAVGVAAVVAVAGLSRSLEQTIRGEARQLLAADLAVSSRRPLPPRLDELLAELPIAARTDVKELVTVVAAPPSAAGPGRSQLVELKVVGTGYPFYGRLGLEPDRPLAELLGERGTVVAPELAARLGLATGDALRVGGAEFQVAGVVRSEPDRVGGAFALGPRVFLSHQGLRRTVLEGRGSRVEHRALLRLPADAGPRQAREVAARLQDGLAAAGNFRVETWSEAQPTLRRGLRRAERFLGLVALLSLLVGGVGIAQTVRAWIASRLDAVAVYACLGMRPRQVFLLYLGETALLGVAGSLVGLAAGTAALYALPPLLGDLVPAGAVQPWQPLALLRGLVLGLTVALLFAFPALTAAARVPPVRVLRRDAEPLPLRRWVATLLGVVLVGAVWGMAAAQARSALLGLRFTAVLLVATAGLLLGAAGLTRALGRLPRLSRVWLRYGLASLARPGAATLGAVVALGLGVLVVLGMQQVESQLVRQLERDLPADAPTTFLLDIQPDQWPGVRDLLDGEAVERLDSVPVVMARLAAIDGQSVADLAGRAAQDRGRRWALTREQRLTYLEELPADNRLVSGTLWSAPDLAEVSVEEEFARDLAVGLGSVLRFDVQGVPLELHVTSLRAVQWESFGINFFLVVEPGVLDEAPQLRLAAARLPRDAEQRLQDLLAAEFPNVTLLQVRDILEKVAAVLRRVGLGVRILGGFTVVAGVAILAGAVSAGAARRRGEVALLKTLGMTRLGVVGALAAEQALVGLVAGAVGGAGAALLSWLVLSRDMELPWEFQPLAYAVALGGAALLAAAAGTAASLDALRRPPVEVLRGE